mmetsp:Transcript_44671/g.51402  ORF Transcript_44671/g.51402 Transcript_44671/m.51402 type:complete len:142 (+) Transcript_44671:512-937(+)
MGNFRHLVSLALFIFALGVHISHTKTFSSKEEAKQDYIIEFNDIDTDGDALLDLSTWKELVIKFIMVEEPGKPLELSDEQTQETIGQAVEQALEEEPLERIDVDTSFEYVMKNIVRRSMKLLLAKAKSIRMDQAKAQYDDM